MNINKNLIGYKLLYTELNVWYCEMGKLQVNVNVPDNMWIHYRINQWMIYISV